MLDLLRQDHHRIRRLLALLDAKAAAIRAGQEVRYDLLKDVLDYLHHYVDGVHHSEEDELVGKIDNDKLKAELTGQHRKLDEATQCLGQRVEMVLMDAVVPCDEMLRALEDFVCEQRAHLAFEEEKLFPLLAGELSEADWRQLATTLEEKAQKDPLFGAEVRADHRALWERLKQEEEE
ncbi:hemerythrin domain-containing protein [Gallaecimonas pentaromativorans]|uniref:Hemerythrin-like domain-containing protein n=1 Tax=Gallaecimonas pentaromativorans TaxID=584787 RepID=A0A3N1PLF3_9GAMM|nr:hemerythrin domain-containing protein [Gallaecimonas pentaromativorans]MED5524708.1 hemerythrin domain-containing protein [Pseudomonadota bacterium]ROQ28698.1 hemerythrin-like domain-containing protein [Gallaecimonas pentaromativorans]